MPHFYPLTVSKVQRETSECVSVTFKIPTHLSSEYQFNAGQYLTLRTHINGQELRRSYSICAAPYQNELTVAVKKVSGGLFSTFANEQLKTGDTLDVMTPIGNFTLSGDIVNTNSTAPETAKQYVFFASGSGITPIISLVKHILHEQPNAQVLLFYGNKNFESIIFREEIEALKNKYLQRLSVQHILSRESLGSPLFKGHLDEDKCRQYAQIFFNVAEIDGFFICGPETMIERVSQALQSLHADPKRVHFELFNTPTSGSLSPKTARTNNADNGSEKDFESHIHVTIDGNSFDFMLYSKGESILDAAHRVGADLPFACKGGVCCTCKAKVLKGQVSMDVNYSLEHDEVVEGYVLTCQSHPTSEEVVISFDEH